MAPLFTTARCPGGRVPAARGPSNPGTLTCLYRVALPTSGIAAGANRWPSAMASAKIGMSGAKCSSAVTQISSTYRNQLLQALQGSSSGGSMPSQPSGPTFAPAPQQGQLGYVPSGCQGLTVTTYAHTNQQPGTISGTVVLTNPTFTDIPISGVKVTLANNVPVAPMFTTATCPGGVVPYNPQPYTVGELVCTFSFTLPTNGPAAKPSVWTGAKSTATIAMSNAQCSSAVAKVGPPLLYGH